MVDFSTGRLWFYNRLLLNRPPDHGDPKPGPHAAPRRRARGDPRDAPRGAAVEGSSLAGGEERPPGPRVGLERPGADLQAAERAVLPLVRRRLFELRSHVPLDLKSIDLIFCEIIPA